MSDTICICQNCGSEWKESELDSIDDIFERVSPGELMPNGQCPDETCGAVCHAKNGPAYISQ